MLEFRQISQAFAWIPAENLKPQRTQRNAAEGAEGLVMEVSHGPAGEHSGGISSTAFGFAHFAKDDSS
jgi:hypothetical protein